MFLARLIDRLRLRRRQQLFAAHAEAAAQLLAPRAPRRDRERLFRDRSAQATARELAGYLNAVADIGLEEGREGFAPCDVLVARHERGAEGASSTTSTSSRAARGPHAPARRRGTRRAMHGRRGCAAFSIWR